jgi:hypothetical protein
MTETIYRHTCDQCGTVRDESPKTGFIPCGGNNWNAFNVSIKDIGTASMQYGATGNRVEFCSYKCIADWANSKME